MLCFLLFLLLCFTQIITATLLHTFTYSLLLFSFFLLFYLQYFFVVFVSADPSIEELVNSLSDIFCLFVPYCFNSSYDSLSDESTGKLTSSSSSTRDVFLSGKNIAVSKKNKKNTQLLLPLRVDFHGAAAEAPGASEINPQTPTHDWALARGASARS